MKKQRQLFKRLENMSFLTNFFKNRKNRNWLIFAFATFAALGSGYLWYGFNTNSSLVCSLDGCNNVLSSPYSKFLGFPVAGLGFFYYFILVLIIELRFFTIHKSMEILFTMTIFTGIMVVLYLRYLEFFVIGSICEQCWLFSFVPTVLITFISLLELKIPKLSLLQSFIEKGKVL